MRHCRYAPHRPEGDVGDVALRLRALGVIITGVRTGGRGVPPAGPMVRSAPVGQPWGRLLAAVLALGALLGAGTARPADAARAETTAGYMRVLPLGDSITRGHGDPAWNGYRSSVQGRLYHLGLRPDMVGPQTAGSMGDNNHAGLSGWRIDQIASLIDKLMAWYDPHVVLLVAGTNDLGQGYDVANAPARLGALVDRILQLSPDTRVFVGGVPKWANTTMKTRVDTYNNAIAGIAKNRGPRVSWVPTHIIGNDPTLELTSDGVHPSACGYARMGYVWWYYLSRSQLNTTGSPWPTGYYPYGTSPGRCAPGTAKRW